MTVQDLIDQLLKLDPQATVYYYDYEAMAEDDLVEVDNVEQDSKGRVKIL